MGWNKKSWGLVGLMMALPLGACSATDQLVGSNGSSVTPGAGGGTGGQPGAAPLSGSVNSFFTELKADGGGCLPRALPRTPTGDVACRVIVARAASTCDCTAPGLSKTSADLSAASQSFMHDLGICGGAGEPPCSQYCQCNVTEATGTSLSQCQTEAAPDADSLGWCYVSSEQGAAANALLSSCPDTSKQSVRFVGQSTPVAGDVYFLACAGNESAPTTPAAVGEGCVGADESNPNFPGYSAGEVTIDSEATSCVSHICVQNHFEGRASCPYGQAAAGGGCTLPGTAEPVNVPVAPQLVARQANVASVCSCQCAGSGPGPFCTCGEGMQCEHLVDDLGLGGTLAGSYCIPKNSQYDRTDPSDACVEPNCGDAHPH